METYGSELNWVIWAITAAVALGIFVVEQVRNVKAPVGFHDNKGNRMNLHERLLMNQLVASSMVATAPQSTTKKLRKQVDGIREKIDTVFERDVDLQNMLTHTLSVVKKCNTCAHKIGPHDLQEVLEVHGTETQLLLELLGDMLTHVADIQLAMFEEK